jgi:hypothetical protein
MTLAQRNDDRARLVPHADVADRLARLQAGAVHDDLRHVQVRAGRGRDRVQERRHLRLEDEVRHRAARGRVREDHAIGPGDLELLRGVFVGAARNDLQIRPNRAR